jgi:hypothetical protein
VYGVVPPELLIAALVTAIPGSVELIGVQMCKPSYSLFHTSQPAHAPLATNGEVSFNLGIMSVDALAGYVFARMAHNGGMFPP